jgi:choline dehydrogenase-like flavoprotein
MRNNHASVGESTYVLGHVDTEIRRLVLQARLYDEFTEHALRLAGLQPGMRVVDVGCAPGDVSFIAARLVGPQGSVLGVDAAPNVIDLARIRGAAIMDLRIRGGKRQSVFRSYTYIYMDRPNLTVLTNAFVRRVIIDRARATGVEVRYRDELRQFRADAEIVLSMGAIHTPKALMLWGIGDQKLLRSLGITIAQHMPVVGQNFHDHLAFTCVWRSPDDHPLHTSPMAYLRNVRLRRAHETLLESDPATATVSSVAYRWGFTNLGRFAAAHTTRYREPPAKTLLRSA